MQLITAGLVATALAASTSLSFAQGSSKGAASGADELHRIMMSSAKESQSMKPSGDVDRDFLTMMRHHHQSGIKMAEVQMREGKSAKVKEMARKIVDGQKKEIAEIEGLLKNHRSSAAGGSHESGSTGNK
jgi:uncharacterized protein (DUF305 family)